MAKITRRSPFKLGMGAIVGIVVLLVATIGGAVALFLNSQGTDARSQASADKVARIWIGPKTVSTKGVSSQEVGIDISQMNAGTTVISFNTSLLVQKKDKVLGDSTLESSGLVKRSCRSDRDCGSGSFCYQPPMPPCPTGKKCPQLMPAPYCKPKIGPTKAVPSPSPTPDFVTPTQVPTSEVLAKSEDGLVMVVGINGYKRVQNLKVTINKNGAVPSGYAITIQGQTQANDAQIQSAFVKNIPIFKVIMNERAGALGGVTLKGASIMGFIPGWPVAVELTKPYSTPTGSYVTPTRRPSSNPTPSLGYVTPTPRVSVGPTRPPYPTISSGANPSPTPPPITIIQVR